MMSYFLGRDMESIDEYTGKIETATVDMAALLKDKQAIEANMLILQTNIDNMEASIRSINRAYSCTGRDTSWFF